MYAPVAYLQQLLRLSTAVATGFLAVPSCSDCSDGAAADVAWIRAILSCLYLL